MFHTQWNCSSYFLGLIELTLPRASWSLQQPPLVVNHCCTDANRWWVGAELPVATVTWSDFWLNSFCLVGVPLCRACPLQLTVILIYSPSCSDVSIDVHVYSKQMEHRPHPFDTVLTHLISAQLYLWVCSVTWGSTEGKSIIGSKNTHYGFL